MLSKFSHDYCPLVYLLWRNVYPDPLLLFKLGSLSFYCGLVRNSFWLQFPLHWSTTFSGSFSQSLLDEHSSIVWKCLFFFTFTFSLSFDDSLLPWDYGNIPARRLMFASTIPRRFQEFHFGIFTACTILSQIPHACTTQLGIESPIVSHFSTHSLKKWPSEILWSEGRVFASSFYWDQGEGVCASFMKDSKL